MPKPGVIVPEMFRNLGTRPVTLSYPFVPVSVPEGFRGTPVFDPKLCVGCKLCVKDCTAEAIEIDLVPTPAPPPAAEGQEAPKVPKRYRMTLYLDRCIHCARCAEVCNKDAIKMDTEFEIANFTRDALKRVTE